MKEIKDAGYITIAYEIADTGILARLKFVHTPIHTLHYVDYTDGSYTIRHYGDSEKELYPEGLIKGLYQEIGEDLPVRIRIYDGKLECREDLERNEPIYVTRDASGFQTGTLTITARIKHGINSKIYIDGNLVDEYSVTFLRYKEGRLFVIPVNMDSNIILASSLIPYHEFIEAISRENPSFLKYNVSLTYSNDNHTEEYTNIDNAGTAYHVMEKYDVTKDEYYAITNRPYPLIHLPANSVRELLDTIRDFIPSTKTTKEF